MTEDVFAGAGYRQILISSDSAGCGPVRDRKVKKADEIATAAWGWRIAQDGDDVGILWEW